ncbi:hypothetical protein L8X50_02360 [Campylobacter sp. CNRCH_2013_0898h]|nr:hypothetical protein [Campylobacter sp. CNRCH_2013_0898h]EID4795991.1 hypothetical protein [Campylobacter lari]MCV3552998.1 hypothetical protein [Campylobacter sp. CNRCH_2013_0898h]
MKNHFDDEEEYMREIKYPYLDEHIIMHKNIVKSMKSLLYECRSTNELKNELYNKYHHGFLIILVYMI